jgi:Family of unknown function (DUF5681)
MDCENGGKPDDGVGYRRPPKHTRWKKGQCGNPSRKRTRAVRGTAEIIDQLFAKPINFIENGSARTANGLEVIMTQLVTKEMAGDRRAMAVRLKYEAFFVSQNGSPDILITSDQSDRRREMAKRAKAEEGRN